MLTLLTSLIGLTPKTAVASDQSQKTNHSDFADVFASLADDGDQTKADESTVDVAIDVDDVSEESSEKVEPSVDDTHGAKARPANDNADVDVDVDDLELFTDVRETSNRSATRDVEEIAVTSAVLSSAKSPGHPEIETTGRFLVEKPSSRQDNWIPFANDPDEIRVPTANGPELSSQPDRKVFVDTPSKPISRGPETTLFKATPADAIPSPVFASNTGPVADEIAPTAARPANASSPKEALIPTPIPIPVAFEAPSRGKMTVSPKAVADTDPIFTPSRTPKETIETAPINMAQLYRAPELQMDSKTDSAPVTGQQAIEPRSGKTNGGRIETLEAGQSRQPRNLPIEPLHSDPVAAKGRVEISRSPTPTLQTAEPVTPVSNTLETITYADDPVDNKLEFKPVDVTVGTAIPQNPSRSKDNQRESLRGESAPTLVEPSKLERRQEFGSEVLPNRSLTDSQATAPDAVKQTNFAMSAIDSDVEMQVSIRRIQPTLERSGSMTVAPPIDAAPDSIELDRLPQAEKAPAVERNVAANRPEQLLFTKQSTPPELRVERPVRDDRAPAPLPSTAAPAKAAHEIPEVMVQKPLQPILPSLPSSVNYPFLAVGDDEAESLEIALQPGSGELRSLQSSTILPSAVTPVRPDPALIMRQVHDGIQKLSEVGGVELRLSPEELGSVRMQFVQGESGLTVHINAERPETLDLIRRHIDQLAKDLADSGFDSAGFSFGDESPKGQSNAGPRDLEATPQDTIPPQNLVANGLDGLDIRV